MKSHASRHFHSAHIEPRGDLAVNVANWRRHLRASNLSPNTVRTYLASIDRFAAFLDERGIPGDLANIRREHVEAFVQHLLERWKPTTAANRYVALNVFFRWVVATWRSFAHSLVRVPVCPRTRSRFRAFGPCEYCHGQFGPAGATEELRGNEPGTPIVGWGRHLDQQL